jgi:hypothetical protein
MTIRQWKLELTMTTPTRAVLITALVISCVACDSIELTIAVNPSHEGVLEVVNSNDRILEDVRLVVEAFESEGTVRTCSDANLSRWRPGQKIRVRQCAEKIRLTLTTGGDTARFSYFNGQLYRRIGRKEVPIAQ